MKASELDQATARALCEAGYMALAEYLRLCAENGWHSKQ